MDVALVGGWIGWDGPDRTVQCPRLSIYLEMVGSLCGVRYSSLPNYIMIFVIHILISVLIICIYHPRYKEI